MINVIMRRKTVADLFQRHANSLEIGPHHAHRPGPAQIYQQARRARTHNPIVRRTVSNVHNSNVSAQA